MAWLYIRDCPVPPMNSSPLGCWWSRSQAKPLADVRLIPALLRVDVPRAQERQQRQAGRGRVRFGQPPRGVLRATLAQALAVELQAPAAVAALVADDPVEAALHGLLGANRPPLAADEPGRVISSRPENGAVMSSAWTRLTTVPSVVLPVPALTRFADGPGSSGEARAPCAGPASSGPASSGPNVARLGIGWLVLIVSAPARPRARAVRRSWTW